VIAINNLDEFGALDPFFRTVEEGLSGLVDGTTSSTSLPTVSGLASSAALLGLSAAWFLTGATIWPIYLSSHVLPACPVRTFAGTVGHYLAEGFTVATIAGVAGTWAFRFVQRARRRPSSEPIKASCGEAHRKPDPPHRLPRPPTGAVGGCGPRTGSARCQREGPALVPAVPTSHFETVMRSRRLPPDRYNMPARTWCPKRAVRSWTVR